MSIVQPPKFTMMRVCDPRWTSHCENTIRHCSQGNSSILGHIYLYPWAFLYHILESKHTCLFWTDSFHNYGTRRLTGHLKPRYKMSSSNLTNGYLWMRMRKLSKECFSRKSMMKPKASLPKQVSNPHFPPPHSHPLTMKFTGSKHPPASPERSRRRTNRNSHWLKSTCPSSQMLILPRSFIPCLPSSRTMSSNYASNIVIASEVFQFDRIASLCTLLFGTILWPNLHDLINTFLGSLVVMSGH